MLENLTIGQLAKRAYVNVETVRYYQRRRLVPVPLRSESGYRRYSQEFVKRIQFIKRAQELGFSLKEIAELLSLQSGPSADCADVKKRAEAKLVDIEAKIRDLQRMHTVLAELVGVCGGSGPTSECPILQALTQNKEE